MEIHIATHTHTHSQTHSKQPITVSKEQNIPLNLFFFFSNKVLHFILKLQMLHSNAVCVPFLHQLGPFESTRVELKGLASGRTYRLQVCAQDLLGLGACSNWSSPVDHVVPRATPWRRSAAL